MIGDGTVAKMPHPVEINEDWLQTKSLLVICASVKPIDIAFDLVIVSAHPIILGHIHCIKSHAYLAAVGLMLIYVHLFVCISLHVVQYHACKIKSIGWKGSQLPLVSLCTICEQCYMELICPSDL